MEGFHGAVTGNASLRPPPPQTGPMRNRNVAHCHPTLGCCTHLPGTCVTHPIECTYHTSDPYRSTCREHSPYAPDRPGRDRQPASFPCHACHHIYTSSVNNSLPMTHAATCTPCYHSLRHFPRRSPQPQLPSSIPPSPSPLLPCLSWPLGVGSLRPHLVWSSSRGSARGTPAPAPLRSPMAG